MYHEEWQNDLLVITVNNNENILHYGNLTKLWIYHNFIHNSLIITLMHKGPGVTFCLKCCYTYDISQTLVSVYNSNPIMHYNSDMYPNTRFKP